MSTTRSQKRRNEQQEGDRNVSEGFVSPIVMENPCSSNQDVEVAGPSRPKLPRIENSFLEDLRASLKEEITSEIKNLLIESQKEMLELLRPETRENIRDNIDEETPSDEQYRHHSGRCLPQRTQIGFHCRSERRCHDGTEEAPDPSQNSRNLKKRGHQNNNQN